MQNRFGDTVDEEQGLGSSSSQSQSRAAPDSSLGAWFSQLWQYPQSLIWGYTSLPADSADPPQVLLVRALREDNPAFIREAIRRDANLLAGLDNDKRTVLHRAACWGKYACIDALIALNADQEAKDAQGRTPLHLAACHGRLGALTILIQAGANKNARDNQNNTPLHLGALWGQIECVRTLFELGADITLLNSHHQTPLQVALGRNPISELSQYLQIVSGYARKPDNGAGAFYQ